MKGWLRKGSLAVVAALIAVGGFVLLGDEETSESEGVRSRPSAEEPAPRSRHATPSPSHVMLASVEPAREPSREQDFAPSRQRNSSKVMVAAQLGGGEGVELDSLRAFWVESADRGAPELAIEAFAQIALANAANERLAAAALDYRDDLLRLRETGERADAALGEPAAATTAVELAGAGAEVAGECDAEEGGLIDLDRLDELEQTLRFEDDDARVKESIELLALHREDIVVDALLLAADHPGPDQRLEALTALWRSAADGVESAEPGGVRGRLERARYDADPRISELAERALADLDTLERAGAGAASAGLAASGDETADCPLELCGPRDDF